MAIPSLTVYSEQSEVREGKADGCCVKKKTVTTAPRDRSLAVREGTGGADRNRERSPPSPCRLGCRKLTAAGTSQTIWFHARQSERRRWPASARSSGVERPPPPATGRSVANRGTIPSGRSPRADKALPMTSSLVDAPSDKPAGARIESPQSDTRLVDAPVVRYRETRSC